MNIQDVKTEQVMSVYAGRAGKCCCGCAGKHSYNSAHVEVASKYRGYEVTPDDVDDRMVLRVLRLVQSVQAAGPLLDDGPDIYSAEIGKTLYIVRMLPQESKQCA